MIKSILWFSAVFFLLSCGNDQQTPSGILKPDKMQAVLWDIIRADAFTTEFIKKDTSKNDVSENLKMQQEIFSIHHISKNDFYKSYEYYKNNGNQMKAIIDSMVNQADRKKIRVKNIKTGRYE